MIEFASVWRRKSHFPAIILESERLYLRPPKAQDYAQWFTTRSRSRHDLEDYEPRWPAGCLTKDFFIKRLRFQSENWARDRSYSFFIFRSGTDELIGGINLNSVLRGGIQHASIGYWLDIHARGHGYMHEATQRLLRFAFNDLKLRRVNISCLPYNERSRKVIERLGFEKEGYAKNYLQINGHWQDHLLYGMTLDHFRQQNTCPNDKTNNQTR